MCVQLFISVSACSAIFVLVRILFVSKFSGRNALKFNAGSDIFGSTARR